MKKGKLVIICGPSGTGKKTVWSGLIDQKKYNTIFSVSMTTRKKRPGEVYGKDYFFLTKPEFKKAIKEGKLLEWAVYVNNYYGTPKSFVEKNLLKGKNVFLEIEMQGVLNILKNWKAKKDLLTIFIAPPSLNALRQRLIGRKTDSKKVIENRIKQAKWELKKKKLFDYVVVNKTVKQAKKDLKKILDKHLLKNGK